MKFDRLHALSDGIFAIAMTLLVLELRSPALAEVSNRSLWLALVAEWPIFFSFIVSFALLFTYWRAHNALMGSYATTLDMGLTHINMVYLMLISLIPFSTRILSEFRTTQVGVGIYVTNIALLGLTLFWMRRYATTHATVETSSAWRRRDHRNATIRTLLPTSVCLIGLLASFWNSNAALVMITLVAFLNVFPWGFEPLLWLFDRLGIGLD
jgi:uncharacterized membrane protein